MINLNDSRPIKCLENFSHSSSICAHFFSFSVNVRDENAIGLSSLPSCMYIAAQSPTGNCLH